MLSRKKLWIFVRDAFIIPIVTWAVFFPIIGPIIFVMAFTYVPVVSEIQTFFGANPHPDFFDALAGATIGYLGFIALTIPFTFMWALHKPRKD